GTPVTVVETRPESEAPDDLAGTESWAAPDGDDRRPIEAPVEAAPELPPLDVRALIATALITSSAALVVGGIFDSWGCRLLGLLAVAAGSAGVAFVLRSRKQLFSQVLTLLAIGFASTLTLTGATCGPSNLT